jgi:hypothetical protein
MTDSAILVLPWQCFAAGRKRGFVKNAGSDFINHRREPREPLNQSVIVTISPRFETSIAGQLTDISNLGLGLTLTLPIRIGTNVAVEWADRVALGEIVHCSKGEGGSNYKVGLRADYIIIDRTARASPMVPKALS